MADPTKILCDETSRRGGRRAKAVAAMVSIGVHGGLLAAILLLRPDLPPTAIAPEPAVVIPVTLYDPPPPPVPDAPAGPPRPSPSSSPPASPLRELVKAPRRISPPRPVRPPPPDIAPLPAPPAEVVRAMPTVGEGQLVGAMTAGFGGAGGEAGAGGGAGSAGRQCDMVRRLQDALRGDPQIRAAIGAAHDTAGGGGRALLVWNGDWVQNPGQAGKGLAGVRQAIALEVAFAPEACRQRPVRGLVLISMSDGPGGARLALGRSAWSWSQLLRG